MRKEAKRKRRHESTSQGENQVKVVGIILPQ
jgi:hypothetical protein